MKTNRKLGFLATLIRDFLIFAATLLVIYIIIFTVSIITIYLKSPDYFVLPIDNNKDLLVSGKYEEFEKEASLGKGGFFIVLNDKLNTIYNSGVTSINISARQLALVPVLQEDFNIDTVKYLGRDNRNYTNVRFTKELNDSQTLYSTITADEEFNIVFTDIEELKGKKLTRKEFNLLIGVYSDNLSIYKTEYKGINGKDYYALFFMNRVSDYQVATYIDKALQYISYSYIFLFIIAILLFLVVLDKKVKRPLVLLSKALKSVANKQYEENIEYTGPREFMEIFNDFNVMSLKLQKEKEQRIKTEKEKQKMLSDISHDLKTPISIIQSYAVAVMDNKVTSDAKKEYLSKIYHKSNTLAELINHFSEYSKVTRSDFKLVKKKTNMCRSLRKYLIEKYNELEFLGYSLNVDIPDYEIYCDVDEFQLKRVYENLISNSVSHNKKGTTIFVEILKCNRNCIIKIGDNGVGIPSNIKDNLFKPFYMGDDSRGEGNGSGLGLAIVNKIILAHSGSIQLNTKDEHKLATLFVIEIPISK